MKKWITYALVLCFLGLFVQPPAHAMGWPLHKKKAKAQAETTQDDKDDATDDSADTSSKPATPPKATLQAPPPDAIVPSAPKVQVQSPLSDELDGLKVEDPVESQSLPLDKTFVAIDDPKNPLGITTSAQKLNDAARLISQKKYKEANTMLLPLKDWLIDATEAHINIYKTLKNVPSAQVQAELEKQLALQFALLRDKAFFQLGMLAVGQEDYSNAVKNLSRVIQSQPRSPMGAQAYEVLQRIGFTEKLQLREDKKS